MPEVSKEALWKKVEYSPHPKQALFHNSPARFKVPVCGRRFGKSRMAAAELLPGMFEKDARYWIVGPTYDLAEKEFRYLWEDIVINLGLGPHLKRKAYNVRTGEMYMEMPWNTRVDVKSADHPDGLVGEGLDGLIVSEAAKQRSVVWEKYLRPALADRRGWAIFPSTPEGFNWYYDLYRRGIDDDHPDWESWNFPSWENPYVYPLGEEDPEILSQKRGEDDPWFWQEIGADFRSFVGKIYTEWKDDIHILNRYVYNPDWPNYLWFDFGFTNPFVALDVQISPSDEIYIWREHYLSGKAPFEHAQHLNARPQPDGYKITCGFGDSADPGAIESLSRSVCATYGNPDAKDITRGIQEVKKFLATYKDENDVEKSHLYVHKACENTIFEFQNYRMKSTRSDENPKEDPKKWADHAMDAVRYGVMHLYVLGARYHLADVMELSRPSSVVDFIGEPFQHETEAVGSLGRGLFKTDTDTVFKMTETPRW